MTDNSQSPEALQRKAVDLAKKVGVECKTQNLTIVIAESATGGLIQHLLTEVSGSSKYFLGGIVAYSNILKQTLLDVPESVIKKHGAVSKETVQAMAEGVQRNLGGKVGLATSGIAGPTGSRINKPIGLVYIAISSKNKNSRNRKFFFEGSRTQNKLNFAIAALELLLETVSS
jgi:PncC family amidohydrolase